MKIPEPGYWQSRPGKSSQTTKQKDEEEKAFGFSPRRRASGWFNNAIRSFSTLCHGYLVVPQSEGDMVELVNVSRPDGGGDHAGVDSDFPCSCNTRVAAWLQDGANAVIVHEHHGHAP